MPVARPESGASTRRRPSRCSYPRSQRSAPVHACAGRRRRPPLRSRRDGPWRRLPRSRSRPARSRSQQGSACSQPEAQRRSISPLALRESPTWRRPLSTQRGARSTCLPPHSRTRLRLFRSPLPGRQSFLRTRRTVPPTWHSIRPPSLRPLPGCTPSSRAGRRRLNSLLAGSRFSRSRRLSRSCPRRPPIPGLPRPRHHRSRRQPARRAEHQEGAKPSPNRQPKPTPGTVEPAAPPAHSSGRPGGTRGRDERFRVGRCHRRRVANAQGSNESGKQKPPSSAPPPPPRGLRRRRTPPTHSDTTPPRSPRRRARLLRLRPSADDDPAPTSTPPPSSAPPPSWSPPPSSTPPVTTPQQQPSWGHPTRQRKWRPEPRPHGTTRALRQRQRAPPLRLPASRAGDGSRTLRSTPRNRPPP